jgi:hypothetical protein
VQDGPPPGQQDGSPRRLANIYALCDVDTDFAAHVFAGYPKAKIYRDFREMLDKEKEIDAVCGVGTVSQLSRAILGPIDIEVLSAASADKAA